MDIKISNYFKKRIHLTGIGGSSMSGLCMLLKERGCLVTGSDKQQSHKTDELLEKGIQVTIGHNAENVEGADLIVYSTAIDKDNPELVEASRLGIPQMERCIALGQLMEKSTYAVCISGTNGKTTTTAMLAQAYLQAGKDPTIHIGGEFGFIDGGTHIGTDGGFLMEACEFHGSFLSFLPTVAVITNITEDHLDYFENADSIEETFEKFIKLLPSDGWCIACGDDVRADKVCRNASRNHLTYGLEEWNDLRPENLTYDDTGRAEYDAIWNGKTIGHFAVGVPGEVNMLNSLAAVAVCLVTDVDLSAAAQALEEFSGVCRRFELTGMTDGVRCYTDYGHNPISIRNSLEIAKSQPHQEIWSVFQPHTFSRTKFLFDQFLTAFDNADHILVTDIFEARETDPGDIHSKMLVKAMQNRGCDVRYVQDFNTAETYLRAHWHAGDMMITHGCGDIVLLNEQIAAHGDSSDIYKYYDLLRLVNRHNPIPEGFQPILEKVYDDEEFQGDVRCTSHLRSMIADCRKAGNNVILRSAYRSKESQLDLFNESVAKYEMEGLSKDDAVAEAVKTISFPGTSEHQTGLAFDIVKENFSEQEKELETTSDYEWLVSHCADYGFILRYPEEYSDITEMVFKPWHFRYVGTESAREMTEKGISLEEYLLLHIRDLNGPFSVVFHDNKVNKWSFACDRFGAGQLYFSCHENEPVFADSIVSLREKLSVPANFREDLLEVYLSYSYLPGEETFFEGIFKALPGYQYTYQNGRLSRKRYFTPVYAFDEKKTPDQWADEIGEVLDDICDREQSGITALLSSGIDSYYLCSRLKAKRTFTASYPNGEISEAPKAAEHAQIIGSEHTEVLITPEKFFALTGDALEALGQPSGDASAPVLMALYRDISNNEGICYSGEGIDELFMGYYYYDMQAISHDVSLIDAEYIGNTQGLEESEKKSVLRHYNGSRKMSYTREAYSLCKCASRLDQAALLDMNIWISGNLLPNVTSLSTASGVMCITPYLDNRLYDLSLQIPAIFKNNGIQNKIVFRKAVEKILGREDAAKRKLGFPVPITAWLKLPESVYKVKTAFSSSAAKKFFHTDRLLEWYEAFIQDTEEEFSWRPIWCIYAFLIWYDRMIEPGSLVPHWQVTDPAFNLKEAWTEKDFPDATLHYFKEAGCLISALATLLRYYDIERETDEMLFNPWILNERLKEAHGFDSAADLILTSVSELYPLGFAGKETYSLEKIAGFLSEKTPCLITVPGVHDATHFVFPIAVQGENVRIIDSGWDKTFLSEFSDAFEIYYFRRMDTLP